MLVRRGLCPSREKAQRLIMAGQIFSGGTRLEKASQTFPEDVPLEVREGERYVGRGGLKLERALHHFGIDPTGLVCLDVGASTGGFSGKSPGCRCRALQCSMTTTRGSLRIFQSSCPCPTSSA
ncbi:MAG: SAM-dependent methyltransferase [Chthoniobacterales bacterium]